MSSVLRISRACAGRRKSSAVLVLSINEVIYFSLAAIASSVEPVTFLIVVDNLSAAALSSIAALTKVTAAALTAASAAAAGRAALLMA